MAAKKTKLVNLALTVSVPSWMTAAQARREVRTLINDHCNWMSQGPQGEEFDDDAVRAVAVRHRKV